MKLVFGLMMMLFSLQGFADCDLKLGRSAGVRVVEFSTGNIVHSKMSLNEISEIALREEMDSLLDMGLCEISYQKKKCVLRFEKGRVNKLTLIRANDKWLTWNLKNKKNAQSFVKMLQKAGACS